MAGLAPQLRKNPLNVSQTSISTYPRGPHESRPPHFVCEQQHALLKTGEI